MLKALSKQPNSEFNSLAKVFLGWCSLLSRVLERLHSLLTQTARIIPIYGMADIGWATAVTRSEGDLTGSIGQPLSGLDLR